MVTFKVQLKTLKNANSDLYGSRKCQLATLIHTTECNFDQSYSHILADNH